VYVANSEPTIWPWGGGLVDVTKRDRYPVNRTAVKLDEIRGGWRILPRETLLHWNPNGAKDSIKPNREGEPEAGKGAKGGRFTGSTEDSGPMKPGDRAEDKTLTTGRRKRREGSEREPTAGDGQQTT
jgi:hypothetical protein